ncbi:MAG: HD domain-containing phosphohydrolase [bacterium]
MSIYAIVPILGGITSLFLGFFVLSRGTKQEVNKAFCYFALSAAIWCFRYVAGYSIPDKDLAIIWLTGLSISLFFIPATLFHFVLVLTKDNSKIRKRLRTLGYIFSFILIFPTYLGFFIKDAIYVYDSYYPIAGGLTNQLFILFFWFFFIYATYLLYRKYKLASSSIEKNRLKYLFIGICIVILGSIPNFLLASQIFNIYPFGYIANVICVSLIAYAILKYQLMDIHVVIRRSFIYSGLSFMVTMGFLLTIYVFVDLFRYIGIYEDERGNFLPALTSGLIVAIIINPVRSKVQHIVDRTFFRERAALDEAIMALRREITSIKDKESLLRLIITTLSKTMQIENLSVMLWDEARHNYTVHTWLGQQQRISFSQDQPLIYWLRGSKRPLAMFNLEDPAWPSESKAKLKQDLDTLQAYCCLPLISKDKLLGVLNLGSRKKKLGYSQTEIALLSMVTRQAGIALENTGLQEKLKGQLLATVRSLTLAVEAKDPKTRGHSKRAGDLAIRLAQAFNLPPNIVEATRIGVFLHNIGKIGVPEEILRKEAHGLTEDEFWLIKKHPKIGVDIIHPLNLSPETIDIVLHHHERIDGLGYPDGLKGEEIALPTRIAVVADAFAAMTSPRSYRPGMSLEEIRTELQHGAGSQFCPQVVKTLFAIL